MTPPRHLRLWLAAVDATTRPGTGGAPACPQRDTVRAAIARAANVYVFVGQWEQDRCVEWMHALHAEARALGLMGCAALCWAAVSAWLDAGIAPWTGLADATGKLAKAMEPEGGDIAAARAGSDLRDRMDAHATRIWGVGPRAAFTPAHAEALP